MRDFLFKAGVDLGKLAESTDTNWLNAMLREKSSGQGSKCSIRYANVMHLQSLVHALCNQRRVGLLGTSSLLVTSLVRGRGQNKGLKSEVSRKCEQRDASVRYNLLKSFFDMSGTEKPETDW